MIRLLRVSLAALVLVGPACVSSAGGRASTTSPSGPKGVLPAPTVAGSTTTGVPASPIPKATGPGVACPATPLMGVYHPSRLHVLGTCRWYRGTVVFASHERDGDWHVNVAPDPGYAGFLNSKNRSEQLGMLVTEIMPGQKLPVPNGGEHVAVLGTWVLDATHGWNEIHPIWAIRYLGSGRLVASLPPVPPLYNGGGPPGGGGGGGGGGKCDPSYPTVCIPPPTPDLNCSDIPYRNFKVLPPDPHHFDGDHDGIGCET